MLALGLIWVLKKVAEKEQYQELCAVLLITVILLVLFFSWVAFFNCFVDPWQGDPGDHFTLSEM